MVIFHSYVSLPEGTSRISQSRPIYPNRKTRSVQTNVLGFFGFRIWWRNFQKQQIRMAIFVGNPGCHKPKNPLGMVCTTHCGDFVDTLLLGLPNYCVWYVLLPVPVRQDFHLKSKLSIAISTFENWYGTGEVFLVEQETRMLHSGAPSYKFVSSLTYIDIIYIYICIIYIMIYSP